MSQLSLFLQLYFRPARSFSRILDEGRIAFAVIAAVLVTLALELPRSGEYQAERSAAFARTVHDRIVQEAGNPDSARRIQQITEDEMAKSSAEESLRERSPATAVQRFTGSDPTATFSPLLAMAVCFVPVTIFVITLLEPLGGVGVVLFRDYVTLLVCCLLAWAAPYLVVLVANTALGAANLPGHNEPALWWAASAWFVVLTAVAVRTLFGATYAHAAAASAAGWFGGVVGIVLYGLLGNLTAYLASPFLLYFLYIGFGSQLSGLASGLRSRQRFKRNLEIATVNPRDADAHCQLGLVYVQRRQYEQAAERFRKAVEVDPNEAEPHYQLGRIARIEGRYPEAVAHCHAALKIDDKHALSEVWRELGAALLLGGNAQAALEALDTYSARREYDPEGNVWRGRALAKLGRIAEARAAFEQAIESVRTMPSARRRQVASWAPEARKEIKKLPG